MTENNEHNSIIDDFSDAKNDFGSAKNTASNLTPNINLGGLIRSDSTGAKKGRRKKTGKKSKASLKGLKKNFARFIKNKPVLIALCIILVFIICIAIGDALMPDTIDQSYNFGDLFTKDHYSFHSPVNIEAKSLERQIDLNLSDENVYLVAKMMLAEAGGEGQQGEKAVVEVILNRYVSELYPDTIIEVLSQSGQFEAYSNGSFDVQQPTVADMELVRSVLRSPRERPINNAYVLNFCNPSLVASDNYISADGWYTIDKIGVKHKYLSYFCKINHHWFFIDDDYIDAVTGPFLKQRNMFNELFEQAFDLIRKDVEQVCEEKGMDVELSLATLPENYVDIYADSNYGFLISMLGYAINKDDPIETQEEKVRYILYGTEKGDASDNRLRSFYNLSYTKKEKTEVLQEEVVEYDEETGEYIVVQERKEKVYEYYDVTVFPFTKNQIAALINRTMDAPLRTGGMTLDEMVSMQIEAMKLKGLTEILGLDNIVKYFYDLSNPEAASNHDYTSQRLSQILPSSAVCNILPIYYQADYPNVIWAEQPVSVAGCTMTCLSMLETYLLFYNRADRLNNPYDIPITASQQSDKKRVATYYGETYSGPSEYFVTPKEFAAKYPNYVVGREMDVDGILNHYSEIYGLNILCKRVALNENSLSALIAEAGAGHIILVRLEAGNKYVHNKSHYVLITGINPEAQTFYVNDPAKSNYKKYGCEYPIADFANNAGYFTSMSPSDTTKASVVSEEGFNYKLKEENVTIEVPGITKSYKIAWISDTHAMADTDNSELKDWDSFLSRHSDGNLMSNDGAHGEDMLLAIRRYLNTHDFDAVIFGGDIIDYCSSANIQLLNEFFEPLAYDTSQLMYIRADHDYGTNLHGNILTPESAYNLQSNREKVRIPNSPVMRIDLGELIIEGVNNSTSGISDEMYSQILEDYNSGKPLIIAMHVPFGSNMDDGAAAALRTMSQKRSSDGYTWNSKNYYPDNTMLAFESNIVFKEDADHFVYVLAGHLHGSWEGNITSTTKEHIFYPGYKGYVGVINIVPKS